MFNHIIRRASQESNAGPDRFMAHLDLRRTRSYPYSVFRRQLSRGPVSRLNRSVLILVACAVAAGCAQPGVAADGGVNPPGTSDSGMNPSPDGGMPDRGMDASFEDAGEPDSGMIPSPDAGAPDAGSSTDAGNPCHPPYQWLDGYCSGPCNSEVLCKCVDGTSQGAACPESLPMACAAVCAPYGGWCSSAGDGGTCAPDGGTLDAGPGDAGEPQCAGTTSGSCPGSETCCPCCGVPGSCTYTCESVEPGGCPLCE